MMFIYTNFNSYKFKSNSKNIFLNIKENMRSSSTAGSCRHSHTVHSVHAIAQCSVQYLVIAALA